MTALLRRLRAGEDEGTALVELCSLVVLLLVPLMWIMLAVFEAQRTAYAAASAVREAGRAYVTAPDQGAAQARARLAAGIVMDDFDVALPPGALSIRGSLEPATFVTVTVRTTVDLPFVPAFLGADSIPVTAQHRAFVDEFR